jgi:integrase
MSIHKGTPTKDGRIWYFTKYKNGINHTSKKFLTKEECLKAESKFVLKNDNPINKRFDLIAEEYLDSVKDTRKISTYNSYKKAYNTHLKTYFGKTYINTITTQKIAKWHEYMLNKKQLTSGLKETDKLLSTAYLNKLYHILKNIFNYAIKNYGLDYNPVSMYGNFEVKREKKETKKTITYEEYKQFISVIDDPLWFTFFNLIFYADPRKGEAMALHWDKVDFKNKSITFDKTLQSDVGKKIETSNKTNKPRVVIMNDELYNVLKKWYDMQKKYTDFNYNWYVFGGTVPLSKTTIDRKKHYYFNLSGVEEITMHQFRHSLTTILCKEYVKVQKQNNQKIDKYAFLSALANRNGHTIETMMKYYATLFPDTEQSQVIDLLNNLE